MNIRLLVLCFLGISFSLVSCFSIDRRGGILKYQSGVAETGFGSFSIARLPSPWSQPHLHLKQMVHENNELKATLVTDALCGPKYVDSPLPQLARDLFDRMDHVKIESQKNSTLDGREAYYLRGHGDVDGVSLKMSVVVMKKNFCLYDFIYFSPPETFSKGELDFLTYVQSIKAHP